jgi:hypothetical protein
VCALFLTWVCLHYITGHLPAWAQSGPDEAPPVPKPHRPPISQIESPVFSTCPEATAVLPSKVCQPKVGPPLTLQDPTCWDRDREQGTSAGDQGHAGWREAPVKQKKQCHKLHFFGSFGPLEKSVPGSGAGKTAEPRASRGDESYKSSEPTGCAERLGNQPEGLLTAKKDTSTAIKSTLCK